MSEPALFHPSDDHLKLISQKVRIDRTFREKIGGNSLVPSFENEFLFWKAYRDDPTKRLIMAFSGEKIIGFFGLDEVNQVAKNARAHVHFWDKSKHIPTLLELVLDHCRFEIGLDRLWGMTNSRNEKALKFAAKIGFKPMGILPNHYRNVEGYGDAVLNNLELFEN